MLDLFKRLIKEEDGLGTVEMVILIAVLVGIALLLRKKIIGFVTYVINKVFTDSNQNEAATMTLG